MSRGRRSKQRAVAAVVVIGVLLAACSSGSEAPSPTSSAPSTTSPATSAPAPSPTDAAERAVVAGYPLVVTHRILQTFAGLAGINTLLRVPRLTTADSRIIVAPNRDTLYALAILDLRGEPQALTVPRIDRYYTFQFIDAWMNTVANVGTRATAGQAGTWVVVPPGYHGSLPTGTHRIESSTNQMFVLGRIRAVDDADAAAAFAASDGLELQPLSALTGATPAPAPPSLTPPAGRPEATGTNGLGYYDELGDALTVNPALDTQTRAALAGASTLGVGAGKHPSSTADASQRRALEAGLAAGNAIADDVGGADLGGTRINGWDVNLHLGEPRKVVDLRRQAVIAKNYWGPNVAAESVYPVARTASDGTALDGTQDYVIHLDGDDLPPVKAFWSYTVYGPDSFFVVNTANRFSIGGDTPGLLRGADGSIDLYLSHTAPSGHEANWLPTPDGPFRLIMRLYLPERPVLEGTYDYPAVTVVRPKG